MSEETIYDEPDDFQNEYDSGPYCPHGLLGDLSDCGEKCKCGHECRQHGCSGPCYVENCPCEEFKDD